MNPWIIATAAAILTAIIAWRPLADWAARRLENLIADALAGDVWDDE